MITERVYMSIRKMRIDNDVDAIFNKTIINRMLKSKICVDGEKKVVSYKTIGEIIDSIIDGSFFNNISLSKRLKQEILDYLKDVGVIEYLENTSKRYNKTMAAQAEQKDAKEKHKELKKQKTKRTKVKQFSNSQNNLQQ